MQPKPIEMKIETLEYNHGGPSSNIAKNYVFVLKKE